MPNELRLDAVQTKNFLSYLAVSRRIRDTLAGVLVELSRKNVLTKKGGFGN
jgi:hypothetical protein